MGQAAADVSPGKIALQRDPRAVARDGSLELTQQNVAMAKQQVVYEVLGAALTGNIDPLRQTFAITESAQAAQWQLVLKPLHPDSPSMSQLKSLTLSGGHFVEAVEIDKGGGDVDHIAFLDQVETAADLSANEKALLGKLGK